MINLAKISTSHKNKKKMMKKTVHGELRREAINAACNKC